MKKKRRRRITFIIFIILLLVLIGGAYYYFVYLGNGVPLVTKEKLNVYDVNSNKRPIAVMIDNNVENDEQVGLQDAYLTYEIIVEGGLTRIMAIYKDVDTSVIGPVRSSRHYFLDYALENDAIYAHYGWSTYAENDIEALSVNNINGLYDDAFYRDSSIAAPHNVFTSIDNLYL